MFYKRKPQFVEAVRYNGSTTHQRELIAWVEGGKLPDPNAIHTRDFGSFEITTALGTQRCHPGDYVVDDGLFGVIPREYFEERFDAESS